MSVSVDQENCSICGSCVDACPNGALEVKGDKLELKPDECIDCNACVDACPNSAIKPAE